MGIAAKIEKLRAEEELKKTEAQRIAERKAIERKNALTVAQGQVVEMLEELRTLGYQTGLHGNNSYSISDGRPYASSPILLEFNYEEWFTEVDEGKGFNSSGIVFNLNDGNRRAKYTKFEDVETFIAEKLVKRN